MTLLPPQSNGRRGIAVRSRSIDAVLRTRTVFVVLLLLGAALFPMTTTVEANSSNDNNNGNNGSNNNGSKIIECGVYLAPSSIPGSGLGMYLGNRSIDIGDTVTDEDILIPIVERPWHIEERLQNAKFLWKEYTWIADAFSKVTIDEIGEALQADISMASPGVGSAANSYLSLVNVEDNYLKISRAGVPPESPGQGAFTIFHGRSFYATVEMEPGQEIFVSYGEDYFTSRVWAYGYLPMPGDFREANRILAEALSLTLYNEDIADDDATTTPTTTTRDSAPRGGDDENAISAREELWNDLHALVKDISSNVFTKSRILNAIPSNASWVEDVLDDGGTAFQDYNRSVKELEWLEEHGQCQDNIAPGKSTIPDAGRGAFATRFIPSGGLVSPTPLVHVGDIQQMAMFMEHVYNEDGRLVPNRSGVYTWQLILNYCFGHEKSTLLLCPYGLLSSLINHSNGETANTKIQWSDKHRMRHPEWLELPINEWAEEFHTGLQLDFVATRDIEKGEEILIDYGDAWQTAWEKHAEGFRYQEYRSEHYRPAYELNDLLYDDSTSFGGSLRTQDDRDYRLDGVQLCCRGWFLEKHGIDMNEFGNDDWVHCKILRQLGDDSYLVQLIRWGDDDSFEVRMWNYYAEDEYTAWGIPRAAFVFEDLPYFRDIHQEWVFRHPVIIPDEIFPDVWKNAGGDGEGSFLQFKERKIEDTD